MRLAAAQEFRSPGSTESLPSALRSSGRQSASPSIQMNSGERWRACSTGVYILGWLSSTPFTGGFAGSSNSARTSGPRSRSSSDSSHWLNCPVSGR